MSGNDIDSCLIAACIVVLICLVAILGAWYGFLHALGVIR